MRRWQNLKFFNAHFQKFGLSCLLRSHLWKYANAFFWWKLDVWPTHWNRYGLRNIGHSYILWTLNSIIIIFSLSMQTRRKSFEQHSKLNVKRHSNETDQLESQLFLQSFNILSLFHYLKMIPVSRDGTL